MARKKKQEEQGISGGWINTFADLMNLLLCFFVLLFSMSTVDADKYEQLVTSMTESINIFDGGGDAIGEGAFVSSGTDASISMSEYFAEFEEAGKDGEDSKNPTSTEEPITEEEYKAQELEKLKKETEEIYESVMGQAKELNVEDEISINMDNQYQYVQISLNGAILFDSGAATIKKSTIPLLSKVGDILKTYDSHMIKIEGHTDDVPISSAQYKNNMWLSTARAVEVFEYFKNKKKISPRTMETTGRGEYDPIATNNTQKGRAQNRRVEIKIYTDK